MTKFPCVDDEATLDHAVRVRVGRRQAVFSVDGHDPVVVAVKLGTSFRLCVVRFWLDTELSVRSVTSGRGCKRKQSEATEHSANRICTALLSADFVDAVFVAGSKEVPVHKAVLATASEVFANMLKSSMREGRDARLDIGDVAGDVVDVFVQYIYTRGVPDMSDISDLSVLFELASRYLMEPLALEVGERMVATADSRTAVKYARILRQHACTGNADAIQLWEEMVEWLHGERDLVKCVAEQLFDALDAVGA